MHGACPVGRGQIWHFEGDQMLHNWSRHYVKVIGRRGTEEGDKVSAPTERETGDIKGLGSRGHDQIGVLSSNSYRSMGVDGFERNEPGVQGSCKEARRIYVGVEDLC